MNQFPENLQTDGRTNGQTLFHNTLPAMAGGPVRPHVLRMLLIDIANIFVNLTVKISCDTL